MKKILTIISIAFLFTAMATLPSNAANKTVLSEEVTNASCGPCAQLNPQYVDFLLQNLNKVVPVHYHGWWPGSDDPMFNANTTMNQQRIIYLFPTTSLTAPCVFVDGAIKNNDINLIKGAISSQSAKTSPITVTVNMTNNGYDYNAEVSVQSTSAIQNKKLHVAVVEAYHYYEAAGNNGEKDFFFIARAMLPDHNGVDLNANTGETKKFNYTFTASKSWYPSMIYVAAWVQDYETKEVLQAGSSPIPQNLASAPSTPRFGVDIEIAKRHGKIANGSSETRDVVIRNKNNKEVTVALSTDASSLPQGWSVDLDKDEVTVPANGTATVQATLTSNANNGLALVFISAVPIKLTNAFPLETSNFFSALSENTKYLFYSNSHNNPAFMYNSFVFLVKNPANKAIIPYFGEFFTAYPPKDYDISLFCFDQPHLGYLSVYTDVSPPAINAIKDLLTAGKKVIITAELELYNTNTSNGTGDAKDFFGNVLGIGNNGDPKARVTITNNQITAVNPYPLTGVAKDPIGDGVNITMNQYLQSHQAFNVFSDIISIKPGSKSKAFVYADNQASNIEGIRYENGDGKLVYMTAGFEGIADENKRNDLMKRILGWFQGAPAGPEVTFDKTVLDFGDIDIGKQKNMNFTITNTGGTILNISKAEVEFSYSHIYSVNPTGPLTVQPGAKANFTVTFKPIDELKRTVKLTITSNASNGTTKTIDLTGKGVDVGSVKDGIASNGDFTMSVSPNPVKEKSTINYSIAGYDSKFIDLYLVNQAGARVADVFSGIQTSGEHTAQITTTNLSSGTYYLILKANGNILDLPVVIVK